MAAASVKKVYFCDFSSDPQKLVPANKNYRKHFSRKKFTPK